MADMLTDIISFRVITFFLTYFVRITAAAAFILMSSIKADELHRVVLTLYTHFICRKFFFSYKNVYMLKNC